jgi:hypothetical protein
MSDDKHRSHIESFVCTDMYSTIGKRHLYLHTPMEPPYCVITYQSPQRRLAIYGSNDRLFDYNHWSAGADGYTVLYRGDDLEEAMAIFEAHEGML